MRPLRLGWAFIVCLTVPVMAPGQVPALPRTPQPVDAPVAALTIAPPGVVPDDPLPLGQQHLIGFSASLFQPMIGSVQITLFRHKGISYAAEAYAGSVLFEAMYGFGGRAIWTAWSDNDDDALLVKPGLGLQIMPDKSAWNNGDLYYGNPYANWRRQTVRYFAAADVDVSWLHEFSPHFAWEMGFKVGIAGKVSGQFGENRFRLARDFSFGDNAYPILNLFSGFRF